MDDEEEQSVAPSHQLESRWKVLESSTTENCSSSSSSSTVPSPLPSPVPTSPVPLDLCAAQTAAPRCTTSPCTDTSSPSPSQSILVHSPTLLADSARKRKRNTEDVLLKRLERLDQEREMARQQDNEDHRFGAVLADMLSQVDPEEKTRVKFRLFQVLFEVLDKQTA
ncbi:hypothetical protein G5714_014738 [Onychostoma macrolepis]|uniref:BESS domain-containing protein n=2 Tax=Onychostoma macrolepis TaxID=369639 RepID=A0A7J6C9L8_9TELE|nr:hypothetical protein G5714_014738 [Onychostoma macrolepis]